jgi:hypothetical protein
LFTEETVLWFVDSSLLAFSVESVSLKRPGLCTGGLDCEVLVVVVVVVVVVVSVFDVFVGVFNLPLRNKSIKFGIIEKFAGSVNELGISGGVGKGPGPITSKLTDDELLV